MIIYLFSYLAIKRHRTLLLSSVLADDILLTMDMSRISTGAVGERLAAEYLRKNKYKIVETNYRNRLGEIDIIARHPKGHTVFVEVKTLRVADDLQQREDRLFPEDHLTPFKLRKLQQLGELYLMHVKPKNPAWQIDLVAIELPSGSDIPSSLRHIEQLERV